MLVRLVSVACLATTLAIPLSASAQVRSLDEWVALAKGGFTVPAGTTAADLLVEMNALLGSRDPVLRDEVAYAAAERWILRDRVVSDADVVRLMELWSGNLDDGLVTTGETRTLKRSFSALCLSLVAARHATTPFLTAPQTQQLVERVFDYFQRERDLRGYDAEVGWVHGIAHAADVLKFLARSRDWTPANGRQLLAAVRARIDAVDTVFVWGEAERIGAVLHSAVRREDAEPAVLDTWLGQWAADHAALWARAPRIEPARYARVENAKQVLRALHAVLAMETTPSPNAEAARRAVLAALARMR